MKKLIIILLFILFVSDTKAQDIHFSQFYNTPLIVNPALTGVFGGDQRAMLVYRNQWATVGTPYNTFGASFDMRMLERRGSNFSMGVGLGVYRDKAGEIGLGVTNVVLSLSGIMKINDKQHFTIGIQGGGEQRTLDNSSTWNEQYDGTGYNPNLQSFETSDYNVGFSAADFNTGVSWIYSESKKRIVNNQDFSLKLGLVYQHISQQELSYGSTADNLYSKISFHGESNVSVNNSNTSFRPSFIYQKQGPSQELLVGTLIRYSFGFDSKYTGLLSSTALFVGLHARIGDAVIPSVGYEITNWKITFSYDANISGLTTASNSLGGFELSLIFVNPNPFSYGRGHSARFK